MIVIPDEVDQELRRAAAAQRTGQMRGIGEILPELFARYALAGEPDVRSAVPSTSGLAGIVLSPIQTDFDASLIQPTR
jgi:hypothetical protein